MIYNAEEENSKADERKFEDVEDDDFNFLMQKLKFQEIMLGGQNSLEMLHKCKIKIEMEIPMILPQLIMHAWNMKIFDDNIMTMQILQMVQDIPSQSKIN